MVRVLMLIFVVTSLLFPYYSATAALSSPDDWGKLLDSYDGQDVHYNGPDPSYTNSDSGYGWLYQCVELVQRYFAIRWGESAHHWPGVGAGWQMFDHAPQDVEGYKNGSATPPRPSDILVFDRQYPTWAWGHVALITNVSGSTIEFVQQNLGTKARASLPINASNTVDNQKYPPVLGWLHSKKNTISPKTSSGSNPAIPFSGNKATCLNLQFSYAPSLAKSVSAKMLPQGTLGPPRTAYPQHTRCGLEGYPVTQPSGFEPAVRVYSVSDFETVNSGAAEWIKSLKDLLAQRIDLTAAYPPQYEPARPLPFLPIEEGADAFYLKPHYLEFQNGSGIAYLTMLVGQQVVLDANSLANGIFYTFQGLTNDGTQYISVTLPAAVTVPLDPAPPNWKTDVQVLKAYNANVVNKLQQADNGQYTPNLDQLDALVRSLNVGPLPAAPPTPMPPPTPPQPSAAQGNALEAAEALVRQKGYDPVVPGNPAQYTTRTLRVVWGQRIQSDTYDQRAFFFVGDKYIGMDTTEPSARMTVVSQDDTTATLEYTLYRPDDPLVDPKGGTATVRLHWDGDKLVPLDPIPAADWKALLSRR